MLNWLKDPKYVSVQEYMEERPWSWNAQGEWVRPREPEPPKSEKLFDDAVNRAGGWANINWEKEGGVLEKREEWSKASAINVSSMMLLLPLGQKCLCAVPWWRIVPWRKLMSFWAPLSKEKPVSDWRMRKWDLLCAHAGTVCSSHTHALTVRAYRV